jgi:Xaa-Pro dipeptidase
VMYEDLHERAHRELSEVLQRSELVRASPAEIDETGVSRVFLPHGLGHSIGLQCHDVGCALVKPKARNPALRNTRCIDAGQAFTVEPGLYFIDSLLDSLRESAQGPKVNWKLVDSLKRFGGIRIEDDLHVMADGQPNNLTRPWLPGSASA